MNGGGWDGAGISAMSWVVRFSFSAAVSWGWRGRSHGHLSGWWVGDPGPTSVAALLPGALGTTEAGRLEFRVTLLLLLGVLTLLAPWPQLENRIGAPPLPFPRFRLLSVSLSTHLYAQCGVLHILGCWAEAPLFCCACLCLPVVYGRGETKAAFRSSFSSGSSFMSRIC